MLKETLLVLKPVALWKSSNDSLYLLRLFRQPNLLKDTSHCHVHHQILEREEGEKGIVSPIWDILISTQKLTNHVLVQSFLLIEELCKLDGLGIVNMSGLEKLLLVSWESFNLNQIVNSFKEFSTVEQNYGLLDYLCSFLHDSYLLETILNSSSISSSAYINVIQRFSDVQKAHVGKLWYL